MTTGGLESSLIFLLFYLCIYFFHLLAPSSRSLASRLQLDLAERSDEKEQSDYGEHFLLLWNSFRKELSHVLTLGCVCGVPLDLEVAGDGEAKTFDTRSFIMSRPQVEESQTRTQQRLQLKEDVQAVIPRTVQTRYKYTSLQRDILCCWHFCVINCTLTDCMSFFIFVILSNISKEKMNYVSPKFIVTLDGVPSPLGNLTECDMELDDMRPPTKVTEANVNLSKEPKVSVLQRLQGVVTSSEGVESCQNLY